MQNKYYVIPTVNVDGLAFIEDNYVQKGVLLDKRTNMNINSDKCEKTMAGVDLNRNYGYQFGKGDTTGIECAADNFRGT